MSINPKYILASGLDEYFVDKDTGLPLSNGTLTFWVDTNRSTPKNVFTISGTPPNYTYVNLGSTINLNATGTPVDGSGNSIVIYYYPYDTDGNVELYYVASFSEDAVPQFTREAWPNTFVPDLSVQQTDNIPNFIPNGQFLLHNNIPANPDLDLPPGRVTQGLTELAPGGWEFNVTDISGGTYEINFPEYGEYVANPTASPRYSCQVQCLGPDPSADKIDLRIKFGDVNKFASDTQQYTFSFTANTYLSSNFTVGLFISKFFGTGGSPSPTVNTFIQNFTITGTTTLFQVSFVFEANTGTQVGTNGDDALYLILGFPHDISFGGQFTDFVLTEGPISITGFPQTTDSDFVVRSMAPPVPDPNGFDLYLPIIATPTGYDYDHSQIGKVYSTVVGTPSIGELLCDGSVYTTADYSSDGIPYARLQEVLLHATGAELPLFGTGTTYVSATSFHTATNALFVTTNQDSVQTVMADGAVPTGFTFTTVILGNADTEFTSFVYGPGDRIWVLNNDVGYPADFFVNSSGNAAFTVNPLPLTYDGEIPGTPHAQQLASVIFNSLPPAGSDFGIISPDTKWYIWYRINGAGTDPAPGGYSPIRIDLLSTMDKYDATYATACAMSGYQVNTITCTAGSSITPNSYFNFYANGTHYYVWMSLNGAGTDPALLTAVGIPVTYQSTFSAAQITNAVIAAIDNLYYAVPDFRGVTFKGWDPTGNIDLNSAFRYAMNRYQISPVSLPHYIGSKQFGTLLSHQHGAIAYSNSGGNSKMALASAAEESTRAIVEPSNIVEAVGTAQNDVNNIYINYVIKY